MNQQPRWINGVEPAPHILKYDGIQVLDMECREQPTTLATLLTAYAEDPEIRETLRTLARFAQKSGPICFFGMGGSFCSSLSGSIHLESEGRFAATIDAGEWLQYAKRPFGDAALSLVVTTSGESAEPLELLRIGRQEPVALLSNNPASKGWREAQYKLPILAGPEYGNATKTYINSTAATIVLAHELLQQPWQSEAGMVQASFARDLDRIFADREKLERFTRDVATVEIVGRGAGYGGAIMSALCIREMSGVRAAPHTGAGFRHGPNLDVDSTHVAIILALGHTRQLGYKLTQECLRRGGKVLLVSDQPQESADRLLTCTLTAVPEPWEGLTSLLVPQALTLALVEQRGCRLPPRFAYGPMEQ